MSSAAEFFALASSTSYVVPFAPLTAVIEMTLSGGSAATCSDVKPSERSTTSLESCPTMKMLMMKNNTMSRRAMSALMLPCGRPRAWRGSAIPMRRKATESMRTPTIRESAPPTNRRVRSTSSPPSVCAWIPQTKRKIAAPTQTKNARMASVACHPALMM